MAKRGTSGKSIDELYLRKLQGKATPEELDEYERLLAAEEDADAQEPEEKPRRGRAVYVSSLDAAAAELGDVNARNLRSWSHRAGFPKKTAKGYNVGAIRRFIAKNRTSNNTKAAQETPEERQEKALLLRAKRQQAELKLAEQRGQLVPAAAAAETVGIIYAQQNAYLERMLESEPPKIAKLDSVDEIREHLRKIVNDMLAQQREFLKRENEKLQLEEKA